MIAPIIRPSAPPAPTNPIFLISPDNATDKDAEQTKIETKVRRAV